MDKRRPGTMVLDIRQVEMKRLRYVAEYIGVLLLFTFFRMFSVPAASNIGGFLARNIGLLLRKEYKKALGHLEFALPHLTLVEKRNIILEMYENIGRFIAEYINQHKMDKEYFKENIVFEEEEEVLNYIKEGCFLVTGHIGNWEALQRCLGVKKADISVIYKPIYNPLINKLYLKQRNIRQIPKGQNAAKQLISLLKERKSIGILIDQREKTGEIFPFFGKDSRTSTVIQRLSLKYNFKIVPIKCVRRKNSPNKFIIKTLPPLTALNKEDIEEAAYSLTFKTLEILENWIKEEPASWLLWSYSRWKITF